MDTSPGQDKIFPTMQPRAETLNNVVLLTDSPASLQEIKLHSFTDCLITGEVSWIPFCQGHTIHILVPKICQLMQLAK